MRRLLLFAVLLSMVSLTTAFAATFDVQAEDITSFSQEVDISVPPQTQTFFLIGGSLPATLSPVPETQGGAVFSKRVRADAATSITDQADPTEFHSWQSAPLQSPLTVASPIARLYLTQNGGSGTITAGLFECDQLACTLFGSSATQIEEGLEQILDFGPFTRTIPAGKSMLLKVVNQANRGDWNIQWGYKANRPARLEFVVPAP